MSFAMDPEPVVGGHPREVRGYKLRTPPAQFLPFLIYEYGLGPISRYFDDQRECIAQGVPWQRVRGTQEAINRALAWIGYDGEHENMPIRRRRWNLFMLEMDRIRDAEEPDLLDIEYLAGLSVARRSIFWRGFKDYDIRPLEYGWSRWGQSLWSDYSGARIHDAGAKWSFGRVYERDYAPTQADLEALDVWIAESDGPSLTWGEFTWQEEDVTWASSPGDVRSRLMAAGVLSKSAWVRFRDGGGDVIGHRRARVKRGVALDGTGPYTLAGANYAPADGSSTVYIEALTDFGDGYDDEIGISLSGSSIISDAPVGTVVGVLSAVSARRAASWSLVFNPALAAGVKPGVLWASPSEASGGVEIMPTACDIEFGRTIRERVKALLRF